MFQNKINLFIYLSIILHITDIWYLWGNGDLRNGCWWKLRGVRNRCGYIGRYMDVIDNDFIFTLLKQTTTSSG
jgi:hypothetical protein